MLDVKQVRHIVENIQTYINKNIEFTERIEKTSYTNELQLNALMHQKEENEDKLIVFIEGMELLEERYKETKLPIHERNIHIVRFRSKGLTYQAIADIVGCTKERIRQVLNESYEYIATNLN